MSHTKLFKIVAAQVDGANFSQRIWQNTDSLKAELDVLLTNNIIQGQNSNVIARRLRSLLNGQYKDNARYITERLARTEFTRVIGQAQKDSYRENDIEYVKWMAESRACRYCVAASEGGL
ncbi:minor capsid protein, partial [Lactobacillus acidophilus]